jgi:fatty-acyl-CoA synthase
MGTDWFAKQTLGALPALAAQRWGAREALLYKGRRWSFAELARDVDAAAKALLAAGVAPGEKVALWMTNRPEWVHLMFAVLKVGAVLLPLNDRLRVNDLAYIVRQSDCATLVLAERSGPVDFLALLREAVPLGGDAAHGAGAAGDFPALRQVLLLGEGPRPGTRHWPELLQAGRAVSDAALAERAAAVDPDALAFLMYTSGTTGLPKGVMHSHVIVRNIVDRISRMGITPADVILMYLPLYHLFGFGEGPLVSALSGARMVLTETFDAAESLALLEQERATLLHGFDVHFQGILDALEARGGAVAPARSGLLASGMASSIPIAYRAQRLLGPLLSGYGMSELGVGAALSFLDSTTEQRCEASGYPAPGYEFRVVDPQSGRTQPADVPGELLVRGYMVTRGYYNKPAETAKTIDAEGWVHTGDMAVLRSDGHVRFMGRYKDMLKVGGENVDPMEVEALLAQHPAVQQVAVVGYPDPRLTEVAVAFVIPQPAQPADAAALIAYCRGKVAGFKVPRHVIFVEALPMTGSGKVQKVKLRELAREQLAPAQGASA